MTAQTCTLCTRPAIPATPGYAADPPMCARHLDLVITVEFLIGRNQEPTQERVLAMLARARQRGGTLAITDAEVPELLPAVLAALGHPGAADRLPADPKIEKERNKE